jgi:type IV pilus assembly protein PilO
MKAMNLEELRRLDFKDMGNWPVLPKLGALAALLLVILAAGYLLDWQGQAETFETEALKEQELRQSFLDRKTQAVNLDVHRKQLQDIEQSFGAMLKQLPNKAEMEALLTDINQAGLGRGLQFDLFRPAPQETLSEFYAELPITIRVTGSYHDIGSFASDVSQLSRIVTLNDIALSTEKDGSIALDATAKTYRYLDEVELSAQRRKDGRKTSGERS